MQLHKLFGTAKNEIWESLSDQLGGEFEHSTFGGSTVRAKVGEWEVTLDTTRSGNAQFTRIRAPFVNPTDFRFTVHPDGMIHEMAEKLLGMQDVVVGDESFDERFVVQGNDVEMLQELFDSQQVRDQIMSQPSIHLTILEDRGWFERSDELPEDVDLLEFKCGGVIHDEERLKELFLLFATVLDRLCQISPAYENS